MTRNTLMVLGLAAGLLVPAAAAAQEPEQVSGDSAAMDRGRQYTEWWYEKAFDQLWEVMGPQMRQALGGSAAGLPGFREQVSSLLGEETEVLGEEVTRAQGMHVYVRRARYSGHEGVIQVQFAMDDAGMISGFYVRPAQ
jgi:hypothetical protein